MATYAHVAAAHYETWEYRQMTSKAQAQVLQRLRVQQT